MGPRCAAVLASVFACASAAAAEGVSMPWYVQAGLAVSHQSGLSGREWVVYPSAPGGTTLGWEFALGRRMDRTVSFEAEVSSTGIMKATEPSRYGMTFVEEIRNRVAVLHLRVHLRLGSVVTVEPLMGFGLLRQSGWSTTQYEDGSATDREEQEPSTAACVSVGLDLRIGNERVAIVPAFRVRKASHGEHFAEDYWYSPPPETQVAVALYGRLSF